MVLILLLALLFAALAAGLFARALAAPRMRSAETIAQIRAYGFAATAEPGREGGSALRPAFDRLAGVLGRRLGRGGEADLKNRLMGAGFYGLPPHRFTGYRVLAGLSLPVAWLSAGLTGGIGPLALVVGALVGGIAGWRGPVLILDRRRHARLERIDYALPELIDVLLVAIEAGLGLSGAMQVAARRIDGPLGDELRLTLQEQSFGLSTEESLRNLLARADTAAVRAFVRSLLQGESLGVSIGQILRNVAVELRQRRRASAEERAQKAPIKMLFPLVFFIFPAMFVVLLMPAIYRFLQAMANA